MPLKFVVIFHMSCLVVLSLRLLQEGPRSSKVWIMTNNIYDNCKLTSSFISTGEMAAQIVFQLEGGGAAEIHVCIVAAVWWGPQQEYVVANARFPTSHPPQRCQCFQLPPMQLLTLPSFLPVSSSHPNFQTYHLLVPFQAHLLPDRLFTMIFTI